MPVVIDARSDNAGIAPERHEFRRFVDDERPRLMLVAKIGHLVNEG